jgi:hypothetical protein
MRDLLQSAKGLSILFLIFVIYPITSANAIDYSFSVEVTDPIKTASLEDFVVLKAELTNTGDLADTIDVYMEYEIPDSSWMVLLCTGGICYPPGVTEADVILAPMESDSATVDITPFDVEGGAWASLRFQSRGDPSLVETVQFGLITDGTAVLIVDGDGGSTYEDYYEAALPRPVTRGIWDILLEPVTSADLGLFDYCVWLTGERVPALSSGEMGTLEGFLDGGGKLFISGQDIGRDIGGTDFYGNYLQASLLTDSTGILALEGIDIDPISEGLNVQISGGDGADNQVRPSAVAPAGENATTTFYYESTQQGAGVISVQYLQGDTSRVVYFAFGFEGISSESDRSTVIQRILEWLAGIRVGIGDDGLVSGDGLALPRAFALHQNYPNPFNPSTTITFKLYEKADVDLSIYDLRGRLVRTVIAGELEPGDHSVMWDGTNEMGNKIGSGSYLYRLRSNDEVITRKMIVVK